MWQILTLTKLLFQDDMKGTQVEVVAKPKVRLF